MEIVTWPTDRFNSKFFAFNEEAVDNTVTSSNMSGRKVSTRINSKAQMAYTFNVKFNKSELAEFWKWYNDELGQFSNWFTCEALGSGYYVFTAKPEPQDTDLKHRVLTLNVVEVF